MHLAYAELCRRHSSSIFRTIQRITRSEEDAEDGLQESLLKAFIHLNKFDGRAKFSTWLTRIAIKSALMIVREKRAHPESPFDRDMLFGLLISDPASDPGRYFFEQERNLKLRNAGVR